MMISLQPDKVAQEFWSGTGVHSVFPRPIEQAVTMRLPVALVKLAPLNRHAIQMWLIERNLRTTLPLDHRDWLGSLVAHRGHGIIFVCESESLEEQRLTIAHETAHFLVDYLWPRQQVLHALGDSITAVLDGERRATPAERAAALLSHVRLGPHVHLLLRPGKEEQAEWAVARAEERADRLAFELVAPWEQVRTLWHSLTREGCAVQDLPVTLAAYFGLPVYVFTRLLRKIQRRRPLSFIAEVKAALRK
jgi:hypothetical protein